MVRLVVIGAAIAGAYYGLGQVKFMQGFAFGVGGMGFTWLALGCIAVGLVAWRVTK